MPYAHKADHIEAGRRRVRRRRRAWFAANGPCANCGSAKRLEVDHIDPAVKLTHRIWAWSDARREAELTKCQVLCHDCHKAKTTSQLPRRATHGSCGMYETHGCRCDLCRAWKSQVNKRRYRGSFGK